MLVGRRRTRSDSLHVAKRVEVAHRVQVQSVEPLLRDDDVRLVPDRNVGCVSRDELLGLAVIALSSALVERQSSPDREDDRPARCGSSRD